MILSLFPQQEHRRRVFDTREGQGVSRLFLLLFETVFTTIRGSADGHQRRLNHASQKRLEDDFARHGSGREEKSRGEQRTGKSSFEKRNDSR